MTIYRKAMEKWGFEKQLNQLQEECAELICASNHLRRQRVSPAAFLREVADVEIMLEQMKEMFHEYNYEEIKRDKLQKLAKHLAN